MNGRPRGETFCKGEIKHVHLVRTKGDPEAVRAWVNGLWEQYDLDGIREFRADDSGPDSLYVLMDIPDTRGAFESMMKHGFGIGLLDDGNLEIADPRGVREEQALELALELGVGVALARGHVNLLERGRTYLPRRGQPDGDTATLVERFRARGISARAITKEEWPEGVTKVAFFGEPRRLPEPGEKVELHVEDGSEHGAWRGGFRAVAKPYFEDGEHVAWVSTEEEYRTALKEGRDPAAQPWPVKQMAAVK
jgi:hypothetical protein